MPGTELQFALEAQEGFARLKFCVPPAGVRNVAPRGGARRAGLRGERECPSYRAERPRSGWKPFVERALAAVQHFLAVVGERAHHVESVLGEGRPSPARMPSRWWVAAAMLRGCRWNALQLDALEVLGAG